VSRNKLVSIGLLLWYLAVSVWMAQAPVDPQFWMLASILPALFVVLLVVTHRFLPLSHTSYALITAFLTLHTIGVH
jgi:putative membrane protein